MTTDNYLIYKHTSPSGKAYIGQTKDYEKRCKEHQRSNGCRIFANAIKRYGWDNFTHEILHDNLTLEQANELEVKYILEQGTLVPNGYNLRTGGLNSKHSQKTRALLSTLGTGRGHSPETRAKLSAINKGKTYSEETRAKVSAAGKGRFCSPETRVKMSIAQKGKIISEESKSKMSAAKKGKRMSLEFCDNVSVRMKDRIVSEETKTRLANTMKSKSFIIMQTVYLTLTLTEKTYSSRILAKLLDMSPNTIYRHFNCYTITTSQIHDYLSQPNPYQQTT